MHTHCVFCEKKVDPSYKDADFLRKFLTARGKIMSRERSGVCSWHQRKLSSEIKMARTLALLPYVIYEV